MHFAVTFRDARFTCCGTSGSQRRRESSSSSSSTPMQCNYGALRGVISWPFGALHVCPAAAAAAHSQRGRLQFYHAHDFTLGFSVVRGRLASICISAHLAEASARKLVRCVISVRSEKSGYWVSPHARLATNDDRV